MHCPYCSHPESTVLDSRVRDNGESRWRKRRCLVCGKTWNTYERQNGVSQKTQETIDAVLDQFDQVKSHVTTASILLKDIDQL